MNKFKQLIKDAYNDSKNRKKHITIGSCKGYVYCYSGRIYGESISPYFGEVDNIDYLLDTFEPQILSLVSRLNNGEQQEIQIYEHELKDYSFRNNKLTINLKNGKMKEFILEE